MHPNMMRKAIEMLISFPRTNECHQWGQGGRDKNHTYILRLVARVLIYNDAKLKGNRVKWLGESMITVAGRS